VILDDLETGGSRGTRTKRELPANDRDPAGNLSAVLTKMFFPLFMQSGGQRIDCIHSNKVGSEV